MINISGKVKCLFIGNCLFLMIWEVLFEKNVCLSMVFIIIIIWFLI